MEVRTDASRGVRKNKEGLPVFDAHGFVEQVNARAWVRHDGRQGGGCMRLDDEHNFNQLAIRVNVLLLRVRVSRVALDVCPRAWARD